MICSIFSIEDLISSSWFLNWVITCSGAFSLNFLFSNLLFIFWSSNNCLSFFSVNFFISSTESIIPLRGTIKTELATTILAAPSLLIEESLKVNNLNNYSIQFGELTRRFEENVIKANIIYIDRFHGQIEKKLALIKKNIIVPTKVIFRNPKNAEDYPFDITEFKPEVKPRARKKSTPVKEEEIKEEVKETIQNKKTTP